MEVVARGTAVREGSCVCMRVLLELYRGLELWA